MTPEQQVTSLELSKHLKELGVKQESAFYWGQMKCDYMLRYLGRATKGIKYTKFKMDGISAFTVAELGEMLPKEIYTKREIVGNWACASSAIINSRPTPAVIALTEADARAKMLIYLIENKLLTV